jgi:hypothetical protein
MKHLLVVLFFCSTLTAAAAPDYNLNVHVGTSRMVLEGNSSAHHQNLDVVIDGKKYQLESIDATNTLLMPGDYKARIVKDHHGADYDVWRVYEIQLPDKKVRQFLMVVVIE